MLARGRRAHEGRDRFRPGLIAAAAVVALSVGLIAASAGSAAAVREQGQGPGLMQPAGAWHLVRPAPGDWEGAGPHGLRMSFALSGRGAGARVPDVAVSLPNGCRSAPEGGFSTVTLSKIAYYPPSRSPEFLPGGAFTIKQPGEFALVGTDVDIPRYPVVITGSFKNRSAGTARVPAYPFRCPRGTGWSRWSRFSLRRSARPVVPDGTYAGTVSGPEPGITGTVRARVLGGGRVLTDFAISYRCSDGTGGFELGPSRAAGEFIAATGAIEEHWTPVGRWSGRFAGGALLGTFTDQGTGDCTQAIATSFSATFGR